MSEMIVNFDSEDSFDVSFDSKDDFECKLDGIIVGDYTGPFKVTPTEQEQTLATAGKTLDQNVVVNPIPSQYIVPEGKKIITANGTDIDVTQYANADVDVPIPPGYIVPSGSQTVTENDTYDVTELAEMVVDVPEPVLQDKIITSSSTQQIVQPDEGYDGLDTVTVNGMANAVFGQVDLSVSPLTPTVNSSTGLVTASVGTTTGEFKPFTSAGYIAETTGIPYKRTGGSKTLQLDTQAGKTITPTTSQQTAVAAGKYTLEDVKVDAIPSQYIVPSGTKQITANGTNIDVTQYEEVDVNVPVPPGYIIPSGTKQISANGMNIDVKEYEYADVAVPATTPTLQTKNKSYTPTEQQQTEVVSADNGYDGLEKVNVIVDAVSPSYVGSGITRRESSDLSASGATVSVPAGYYANNAQKSVAAGTEGTPTASKGTVSNHAVTITPSVTNQAGYISGGTKTGTGVSVAASELVSGTKEINANGTDIDVTNYEKVNVAVPSGGSSMNVQVDNACHRMGSSTKAQLASLTVATAGKYDIYWSAFKSNTSTQYTNGTECRINGTIEGTENTTWQNSYMQANKIAGVTLAKNDVVTIWGRSRGSNYYVGCMNLTLIQVA